MSSSNQPLPENDDTDSEMVSNSDRVRPSSPSMASSQTSFTPSMRSASPVSVLSFTSAMIRDAYRREFGRELNNSSEVYRLPADNEELRRLGEAFDIIPKVS
jgi:hypothetical protein